jgi:CNT family concentrative nucleoside transporter
MHRFVGLLGILVFLGLAAAFSTNRRAIRIKTVLWGLGLQFAFAVLVTKLDFGRRVLQGAGDVVTRILSYSDFGAQFVFGPLADPNGPAGLVFAFKILPTIIFVSAIFAVLYYLGIMQAIITAVAKFMTWVMGISGVESMNVAASIFMGQTEAPLTIRPYLPRVTQSELMTIMTAGMAHVSGSIMAAYIFFGHVQAKHLLGAVIMTAPGTILISKMLVPETEQPVSGSKVELADISEFKDKNFLGAIARGTLDGLHLAVNVGAMLISFIALIYLVDGGMGWLHNHVGWFPASLEIIFGWVLSPVAWLIGIPWRDATQIGNLLGVRMVLNELVAFTRLGNLQSTLDPRTFTIATYALCGFANFSSIGIQIGGIGALAPNKKDELARFGIRPMLAGTMANLISACIVGMLI